LGDKQHYKSDWKVAGDYRYQIIRNRDGRVFSFRQLMKGNRPDPEMKEQPCVRDDLPPGIQVAYDVLVAGGVPSMSVKQQADYYPHTQPSAR
jgi:hypothetical protein